MNWSRAVRVLVGALLATSAWADTQFYRDLERRDVATWEDLLRVAHILRTDTNEPKTFDEYRAWAVQEEVVDKDWDDPADSPVTKGRLAYVLCKCLRIKGGVMMHLVGTTERYAYREMLFLGLMGKASQHRYVSGGELLTVLRRAREYKKSHEE